MVPPDDLVKLARGLLQIELLAAREMSLQLPVTSDFAEHAAIAMRIGGCGRRISVLASTMPTYARGHAVEIAAKPSSESAASTSSGSSWSFTQLYDYLLSQTSALGRKSFDLRLALENCKEILRVSGEPGPPKLQVIRDPRVIDELIQSGTDRSSEGPVRSRAGNTQHKHDSRWRLAARGEVLPRMRRVESPEGLLHKLHHTAFRETVASEIAALNLLEYDFLPWDFYVDMARQTEDEARHSELAADLLLSRGGRFQDFKLPQFGNYYMMFLGMTLTERLVTLNLDIEATGQAYLRSIANRLEAKGDVEAGETFAYIARDEQRHAQMGTYWLRWLYPDEAARHQAIEHSRALTAINLAAAEAAHVGGSVLGALQRWIEGQWPVEYDNPGDGSDFEPEITPLVARTKSRSIA